MAIWSAEIKELEKLHESLKGQLPGLEKELERLIKADDENMILLYSRRCLEVIITELCECELKRERGTEPLKGIIDKLHKERKIPPHIIASIHSLNELSTFGTHPKDFDPEQIKPVLVNLNIIIKWYLKHKESDRYLKVKPAEEIPEEIKSTEDIKKKKAFPRRKLIIITSSIIAVILIVFVVLLLSNKELEKSIAVLPFINESPVDSNKHFINGVMEEILNNLQAIKEFRVLARTSTSQYQDLNRPTISEIAKKLGVSYIVEGSGQKYGNIFTLRVQLIRAKSKETQLWGNTYNEEIREVGDYVRIQSEVAKTIAAELKIIITPEEKQLIEKTPTANLKAYDFYQRGREEESKYSLINIGGFSIAPTSSDRQALERAKKMYNTALRYDSTFALAYVGLASVYWNKWYYKEYFSEDFLDSVLILAKKALVFDNQLSEAYTLKGLYYDENGNSELADVEFDKAIQYNPNNWIAYYRKEDIKSLQKAASLNRGSGLPLIISSLAMAYFDAGFIEEANNNLENLKLIGDPIQYFYWAAYGLHKQGNWEKSIEFATKGYAIDSTDVNILDHLGYCYSFLGQFEESLKFYTKFIERKKALGQFYLLSAHRIGYTYAKNGYKKEADYYFDKQINWCDSIIRLNRPWAQAHYTYYDLAGVYAFRGDKAKAYENLRIFNQRKTEYLWMVSLIEDDPLFESIRNEPEFQQIIRDVEAKFQAEHERVKKWLEEQGML